MTDTAPDVKERLDALMRRRSGSDRVRMMSEMFDFAKTLVRANLRNTHIEASERELSVLLFDRLYGDELDPAQRTGIAVRLRGERPTE